MKVCTDACIMGAYVPVEGAENILDIGTGTGLLSLMVAQRTSANIIAVEIDEAASEQAKENVSSSPFNNISVINKDIIKFANHSPLKKFDIILCNPPFYQNSLKSPVKGKNISKHDLYLSLGDLVKVVKNLLKDAGKFYVLLPPAESVIFENLAKKAGLFSFSKLEIRNRADKSIFRLITGFTTKEVSEISIEELIIKEINDKYTIDFQNLLKNYYLIF